MSSEQYWRHQLAQTEAEYEQIIQGLRDEVEKHRRRCSELVHEQAMQRATAAADVRNFCAQYIADAKTTQRNPSSAATAAATSLSQRNAESIPLPALLTFLHEYSHGLLQLPENRRKRERVDLALNPVHHRLRQRMLARHRLIGREEDALDEVGEEGLMVAAASPVGSPASPPMGPSMGAPPAALRFPNAAAAQSPRAEVHVDVADVAAPPRTEASARVDASRSGGGAVLAASMFGLPTLPPR